MGASKSVAETFEDAAQDMALCSPRYVIEGWLAGCRADGDRPGARMCERALEIQAEWKVLS